MSPKQSMTAALLVLMPAVAFAQKVDTRAERLAASCANCHGTSGVAAGSNIPGLAGQSKEAILDKFQAFKAGAAPATVMHQLAKGYTEEQIVLIAEFFARQAAASAR